MKLAPPSARSRGFTLTEVLIASSVSLIIFGAVCTATIFLRRTYATSMDYMISTADQQRAMDYIARDLRRALTVTPSGQTMTITVPDTYASYDSNGNPVGALVTPTISNGAVNYNNAALPVTIYYYISNGQLMRRQTIGATGAVSTFAITNGNGVDNLQSQFTDLTSPVFPGLTTVVNFTVTFTPDPHLSGSSGANKATSLTASTSIRSALRY